MRKIAGKFLELYKDDFAQLEEMLNKEKYRCALISSSDYLAGKLREITDVSEYLIEGPHIIFGGDEVLTCLVIPLKYTGPSAKKNGESYNEERTVAMRMLFERWKEEEINKMDAEDPSDSPEFLNWLQEVGFAQSEFCVFG